MNSRELAKITVKLFQEGVDIDKMVNGEIEERFGVSSQEENLIISMLNPLLILEILDGGEGSSLKKIKKVKPYFRKLVMEELGDVGKS
jgi:hypothetical protein